MAPVPKNTIEHFTHPGHKLVALNAATEFLCDGCKTLGRGARFRCNACHVDLHDFCGSCPAALSSFMHPHPLSLVVRKAQGARQNERTCDVCCDGVERLFYRCKGCEFDVHPLCTRLPQSLRHALHPLHPLTLQPWTCSWCAVCRGACTTWRYRCGVCNVDIHLDCVLAPPPLVPLPYGRGYPYGVLPGSSGYNYPNQSQGGGATNGSNGGSQGIGKMMYALVEKLDFGVLSNVVFGLAGTDFSSFM